MSLQNNEAILHLTICILMNSVMYQLEMII